MPRGACRNLCDYARASKSNVGCEYWAVDLDNAMVDATRNAAAQQFAVVVSNPQPDRRAEVDDRAGRRAPGEHAAPSARSPTRDDPAAQPRDLQARPARGRRQPRRRVQHRDRHGAHAPRLPDQEPTSRSSPTSSTRSRTSTSSPTTRRSSSRSRRSPTTRARIGPRLRRRRLAADHRQHRRSRHQLQPANPIDLRAFLTHRRHAPDTHVRVTTTTRVIAGGPVPETQPGGVIEATLEPFDVLNLETGGFNADFTSSTHRRRPAGRRLSRAAKLPTRPYFDELSTASAAPTTSRSSSIRFARPARTSSSRTRRAAREAVATPVPQSASLPEPEFFRIVAVSDEGRNVETSLPPPTIVPPCAARRHARSGDVRRRRWSKSDGPVIVGDVQAEPGGSLRAPRACPAASEPGHLSPDRAVPSRLCLSHARQVRLRLHRRHRAARRDRRARRPAPRRQCAAAWGTSPGSTSTGASSASQIDHDASPEPT